MFLYSRAHCVCIVSMLCLILNFLGLYLILNFLSSCLILNFLGEKKTHKFSFFKTYSRVFQKRSYRPTAAFFKNAAIGLQPITMIINAAQSGSIATFFKNAAIGPKPIVVVFKSRL